MSTKISALPAATTAAAADVIPFVQGGVTKKVALSLVRGLPITDAALVGAPRTLTALEHTAAVGGDQLTLGGDAALTVSKWFDFVTILAAQSIDWSCDALAGTMNVTAAGVHAANGKYIGFLDLADITTLPTTGRIRFPYNGGGSVIPMLVVKDSIAADRTLLAWGAGDLFDVGYTAASLRLFGYDMLLETVSSTITVVAQGATSLTLDANHIKCGQPIHGEPAAPSPYSVHGALDVDIAGDDHVLTAAEYAREFIRISGNDVAGPWRVNLPTVSDDAHAYYKYLYVTAVDFATNVVFTAKDDTTDDLSLAPGTSALVCVDATHGLRKLSNLAFTP